jgi:hypothetical protein
MMPVRLVPNYSAAKYSNAFCLNFMYLLPSPTLEVGKEFALT